MSLISDQWKVGQTSKGAFSSSMLAAVAVFSVRKNDVLPGNFPSLEHCQKIRLARFRVEVLSFYLAVNFSYVSYISQLQNMF